MKKKTLIAILTVSMGLTCTSCAFNPADLIGGHTSETTTEETPQTEEQQVPDKPDDSGDEVQTQPADTKLDIKSDDEIMAFVAGEWMLTDTVSGDDCGRLTVSETGEIEYERLSDGLTAEGSIRFSQAKDCRQGADFGGEEDRYVGYSLAVHDPSDKFMLPDLMYPPNADEFGGGDFFIGRGPDEDFLYLTFVGNGDSFVLYNIFQNMDRIYEEYADFGSYDVQDTWVFHRDNGGIGSKDVPKVGDFYGLIWGGMDDGVLVQPMDLFSFEAEEDYTIRQFEAGLFTETGNIAAGYYSLDGANTSLVFHDKALYTMQNPIMCKVNTDMQGNIRILEEVTQSYYGIYDMGDLPAKFSYDGLTFTYNGMEYDLRDWDTPANAIMDAYEVGDEWIVIEAHINPHVGCYYLFNKYSGDIERRIDGAGLISRNSNDITTSVYSSWDLVYNWKGHVIGQTDNGSEVMELGFGEDGPLVVAEDLNGKEYFFDETYGDEAMYAYGKFLRHKTPENWKDFMSYAPDGAIGFVMINPTPEMNRHLPWPQDNTSGSDTVYFVALEDDTYIDYETGQSVYDENEDDDFKWVPGKVLDVATLSKGEARAYSTTVPEGIPTSMIHIVSGNRSGEFEVFELSGETDLSCAFIGSSSTASDVERHTRADLPKTYDNNYEAYMDVLYAFQKAEEEKYDEAELVANGLPTELIQYGWPYASTGAQITYVTKDLNGDGVVELILCYNGSVQAVYGFDGSQAVLLFSTPYRSITELREGGYLINTQTYSAASFTTTYYGLDSFTCRMLPSLQVRNDGKGSETYYSRTEFGEWYELDEDVFVEVQSDLMYYNLPIELPEGKPLADFDGTFK
ncbi:MAG: hypothetical protein J5509_02630 [Lachnospiraceae bacterium]|nr:hypothetical protein [Lachnospiraceae bacterium]